MRDAFASVQWALFCVCLSYSVIVQAGAPSVQGAHDASLYRWVVNPADEMARMEVAGERLEQAIKNPEYLLNHWIELPTAPKSRSNQALHLSLREALLLALRYNPNIQNSELDRIIQRYQLRLAHNEFELQYALAGTAFMQQSHFNGIGTAKTNSALMTPELSLNTPLGTNFDLKMDNNIAPEGNYNPLLNFSITQPLLRGFGKQVNEARLRDAIDHEWFNRLNLRQAVMDQMTLVITNYRALILSGNNLENQRRQLEEARKSYEMNEKKITAGQLEATGNIQQSYQIESLSLMVEQAENDFKIAAQALLQTIGLDPEMKLAVPSDVTLHRITIPDVNDAIQKALKHNTQYLALKMAVRADERAYAVAKNQQQWELNLSVNAQLGTTNDVDNNTNNLRSIFSGRNNTETVGVKLSIPMNDIARRNQLITAKIQLEKDRLNLIAAKRALITTIKNTINSIESQSKQYELAKRQVKLASKSYDLEKKKQQAGIASALDVNNTQNQLLQAQMGLIHAKIAYLNELSALQRFLGTTLDAWQIKLRDCE